MKTNRRKGSLAFTLVELMASIAIMVLLVSLVAGGLKFASERQDKEKARLQVDLICKALEAYKLDMGFYPPTINSVTSAVHGTGNSELLYQALFYEGYSYIAQGSPAIWNKAKKIYLSDLDPTSSQQGWVAPVTGANAVPPASTPILDPWGKPYCYRSALNSSGAANTATQNPEFDLWSMGKDGVTVLPTPGNYANRDDIRNF